MVGHILGEFSPTRTFRGHSTNLSECLLFFEYGRSRGSPESIMKFRHHLAKETFKGKKKNTERGVEDLIDPDQRGNQSSANVETNILSLDKDTITPEPVKEEPQEMSRRDMFSLGNFLYFFTSL